MVARKRRKLLIIFLIIGGFCRKLKGNISVYLKECYRLYQIICLLKRFHQVLNELHASCGSLAPAVNDLCLVSVKEPYSYKGNILVFCSRKLDISICFAGATCSGAVAVWEVHGID